MEDITVNADEAVIVGDGLNEVESVTYNEQEVEFKPASDGKRMRLTGLRAVHATDSAATSRFLVKFKSEAKPKEVEIRLC
jgi:hypothetical protein